MGCCLCRSKSTFTEDPDIFHIEATALHTVLPGNYAHDGVKNVLVYVKNDKLYHVPTCGTQALCCLCTGFSRKLGKIGNVQVITGELNVFDHQQRLLKAYNIPLGLTVTIPDWRDCMLSCHTIPVTKIYRTPDAVKLATLLQPHVKGTVVTEPTNVNISIHYPGEGGVFFC